MEKAGEKANHLRDDKIVWQRFAICLQQQLSRTGFESFPCRLGVLEAFQGKICYTC